MEKDDETKAARLGLHLNNLGGRLGDLGRREEALAATEEAVGILRTLAAARPEAFLPGLAGSLGLAAYILNQDHQYAAALPLAAEAFATLLPFFRQYPAAFQPLMEFVLEVYNTVLQETGGSPLDGLVDTLGFPWR